MGQRDTKDQNEWKTLWETVKMREREKDRIIESRKSIVMSELLSPLSTRDFESIFKVDLRNEPPVPQR